jgi:HD-GYP domain-containing protein (c-di-GMP phosphodiesterase class II)
MSSNLIPIRLSTLKADIAFGFSILLRLNENYIKYIHPEDDIEQYRLDNLKQKKVKKVYIDSNDEGKYHNFLDRLLASTASGNMSAQAKTSIIAGATADALEKVYKDPSSKFAYTQTQKAASSLVNATQASPEILKEIFQIESEDDIAISCAICTSTTAISLGRKLGVSADKLLVIGTAALLCDLSLPQLESDYQKFFTKNIAEFSAEESKSYREHPLKSAEILQNKEYASSQVLSIILNHEEKLNGKGFPKGISKLSQEEKIVSLCNRFSLMTVGMKMSTEIALKEVIIQDVGAFDLEMIKVLKSVVGGK